MILNGALVALIATAMFGIMTRGFERNAVFVMKTQLPQASRKESRTRHGFLEVDMLVGLAIFSLAIVPVGFSFVRERQVLKLEYFRSVANEIVDGEMEILAAGDWKNFRDGSQNYPVHASAAASLPPGHFQLTKTGNHLRLEWDSDAKHGGAPVIREATLR